jgi:hypothetical protein
MRWGTGPTQYCSACGASRNMLHTPGPWRAPNFEDLAALEESKPELMAKIRVILSPNEKGQRREPAARDVVFVSERIGWLPFAGPSGSTFMRQ